MEISRSSTPMPAYSSANESLQDPFDGIEGECRSTVPLVEINAFLRRVENPGTRERSKRLIIDLWRDQLLTSSQALQWLEHQDLIKLEIWPADVDMFMKFYVYREDRKCYNLQQIK